MSEYNDAVLTEEQLRAVSGGAEESEPKFLAYCSLCGDLMDDAGFKKIMGGLTEVYVCTNTLCSECGKNKTNDQVKLVRQE